MSLHRLVIALVFAGATIHSCDNDGDKTALGSVDDAGPQPIPGFSVADELSPWGTHSPLQGSALEVESFPVTDFRGGSGTKDAIPAITNPSFLGPTEVDYLLEDDLVLGLVVNGIARAYPERIEWWHEIVNDEIGGFPVAVTFCSLTGTGMALKAADGGPFALGVSGLLFNSNLIMYDRRDFITLYPQMYFTGVFGGRKGESLTLLPITETKWGTWKKLYPDTEVIALGNGTYQNESVYDHYPYPNYLETEAVISPLDPSPHFNPPTPIRSTTAGRRPCWAYDWTVKSRLTCSKTWVKESS